MFPPPDPDEIRVTRGDPVRGWFVCHPEWDAPVLYRTLQAALETAGGTMRMYDEYPQQEEG